LIWVVAQLFESATRKSEMDPADHLRLLVGRLEQGATMQLDDAGAGICSRGEPKLIQQVDSLAANNHSTRRQRRARSWALAGRAGAHLGLPH